MLNPSLPEYLRARDERDASPDAPVVTVSSAGTLPSHITHTHGKFVALLSATLAAGTAAGLPAQADAHIPPVRDDLPSATAAESMARNRPPLDAGKVEFFLNLQKYGLDPYGKMPTDKLETVLLELLNHSSHLVRAHAMYHAGNMKLKSAIPSLRSWLRADDWLEAKAAAESLAKISHAHPEALDALVETLDEPPAVEQGLAGLRKAGRAQGKLAESLNGKLKGMVDGSDGNPLRKVGAAAALLQTGTAHQEEMIAHVHAATKSEDRNSRKQSRRFLFNDIRRNPDPRVGAYLRTAHRTARIAKDGDDALATGLGLAKMEHVPSSNEILDLLTILRGQNALHIAQRVYASYDLIEMNAKRIMDLAEFHPDREVRLMLIAAAAETFRGQHVQEWVRERRRIEEGRPAETTDAK